jgi:hypothetical protein
MNTPPLTKSTATYQNKFDVPNGTSANTSHSGSSSGMGNFWLSHPDGEPVDKKSNMRGCEMGTTPVSAHAGSHCTFC